jgi:hypothetical protein
VQFRVAESYMREWTKGEVALVLQAQAEAVRSGKVSCATRFFSAGTPAAQLTAGE